MQGENEPPPLEVFGAARSKLKDAAKARKDLHNAWNQMCGRGLFEAHVTTDSDGSGELWSYSAVPSREASSLDSLAKLFLTTVKEAMDAAVVAAAETVCKPLAPIDPALHRMPLTASKQDFEALVPGGQLLGLRPDQVDTLRLLQPWQTDSGGSDFVSRAMSHLAQLLFSAEKDESLVAIWITNERPDFLLKEGATVRDLEVQPDGALRSRKLLAKFRVTPPVGVVGLQVRPNAALDPIFNALPWPIDPDDNLNARSNALLVIAQHLIDGLERSVSTPSFFQHFGPLNDLAPAGESSVWLPVVFDEPTQEAEVRQGLEQSDLNLASFRGRNGEYSLLRLEGEQVVGREIPDASPPEPTVALGAGVELAALDAAAAFGLPDFVFRPKVVQKGSGLREVGDGTLISAGRGIALQVKARDGATENSQRETNWIKKKAAEGLRQAHGTIRSTLSDPNLRLTNLRDREVSLTGDAIEWIPVVIIDHPSPPEDVIPDLEPEKDGLILLRRDWEFLLAQLRSVSALINYAHRVQSDERIALGTEANRYFDLADRDSRAEAEPLAPWMKGLGSVSHSSDPQLPREPASTGDLFGHNVFQQILEDIAATDFTGDEQTRVDVLTLIDQVAVVHRAELGRTLIRRLDYCALAPVDTLRVQHRIMFINKGELHLAFSVYGQLTGHHRQLYETWLLHRRQKFLNESGATGPDYPWTVGILLTPRLGGGRLWDTTVYATQGGPTYDQDEFEALEQVFGEAGGQEPAID